MRSRQHVFQVQSALSRNDCQLKQIGRRTRRHHAITAQRKYIPSPPGSSNYAAVPSVSSRRKCFTEQYGRRHYAVAQPSSAVKDVGILGGGITGMAAAYYLSNQFPDAKITLYELGPQLGGWMRSKLVDVGDGEVIFEQGPRSLRPQAPNGALALRLVEQLGMIDDMLVTPKTAPAARNRFIYYPDHLVRLPGPGQSPWSNGINVLLEPAFDGLIRGIFTEAWKDDRAPSLQDESIGEFVTRRLNKTVANNLASAMFHGIYAGDIWKLSAKSILALTWAQELKYKELSSIIVDSVVNKAAWLFCDDIEMQNNLREGGWDPRLVDTAKSASVFMFKEGLGQLGERLEQWLASRKNVTIRRGTAVDCLRVLNDSDGDIALTIRDMAKIKQDTDYPAEHPTHTHVISTLSSTRLAILTEDTPKQEGLSVLADATYAVTVAVVNLYYRTPNLLTTVRPPGGLPRGTSATGLRGFGYLIPNSVPFEQNPERALGVIFDSDIAPDLYSTVPPEKQGTRLTVMLGGHWWDGWQEYPSNEDLKEMAMTVLARHLGVDERPIVAQATLQHQCIPQYEVGHTARMAEAHNMLQAMYGGRLRVAGSWYTGVGVNDCLRSAWDVVRGLKNMEEASSASLRERWRTATGLEKFKWGRPMARIKRRRDHTVEVVELDEAARELYPMFADARPTINNTSS